MTIVEILDGLAELGRLRLERERQTAKQAAALAQAQDVAQSPTPTTDITQPAAHDDGNA